jgi:hypothetical protein
VKQWKYELKPEDAQHLFQELDEHAPTHGPEERKLYLDLYRWWHG